jgi:hypothetical protein
VGTQQRDHVAVLARTNPAEALELARTIEDPWFRCQALSFAAEHGPDPRFQLRAIDEAFAAASELSEPNRVVSVSSWPVKALALTGHLSRVASEVDRLIQLISTEPSPVRRADALRALLEAVSRAPATVAVRVAQEFSAACLAPLKNGQRNPKGESHLEDCLPAIARIDSDLAWDLRTRLTALRSERAARALR